MFNELRKEQHYAVSKEGVLFHIREAHKSNEDFYCPHCGCRMLKRCGQIRRWHFAHDWRNADELQKKCSYESYLHSYAKLRIKQWFEESNSIVLHYQRCYKCESYDVCIWKNQYSENNCKKTIAESFDLKKCLNVCVVEKEIQIEDSLFRPDLLWQDYFNPNNYIFVEIKVTHECSEQKKYSSARIIEFAIRSEEDIERIVTSDIRESDMTKFYGFNTESVDRKGYIKPVYNLKKFRLYKSGKIYANIDCTCQDYKLRHPSSLFEMTSINDKMDIGYFYNYGLTAAIERGFSLRNCYVCEYKKYQSELDCLGCSKKGTEIERACDALICNDFKFNEGHYAKYYDSLCNWLRCAKVDIWSTSEKR